MQLILFDIDGTLVDCGRQVRPLFAAALDEVFGATGDLDTYDFAGKTDPRIVFDLMRGVGLPDEAIVAGLPRMREVYVRNLARGLRRDGMRVLPGVPEMLASLQGRADVAIGLLTGNWEAGARIKLGLCGLFDYFAFGAFGEDGPARADLVPAALRRATAHAGRDFGPLDTVIVGDSREDVACARAHGVPSLAVATGRTPAAALLAAGADWVIPDLWAARHHHAVLAF